MVVQYDQLRLLQFQQQLLIFHLYQNADIILTSIGHYAAPISRIEQLLDNMDSTVDSEKVFLTINSLSSKSSDEEKK